LFLRRVVGIVRDRGGGGRWGERQGGGRGIELLEKVTVGLFEAVTGVEEEEEALEGVASVPEVGEA